MKSSICSKVLESIAVEIDAADAMADWESDVFSTKTLGTILPKYKS